jgi:hypothetical protein
VTGILTAGTAAGTGLNTINLTGIGGTGTAGSHQGVLIATSFTVNLQGTNVGNSLNFLNCVGGVGGINNGGNTFGNCGVKIGAGFTMAQAQLLFQNCTGGSGATGNTAHHGVMLIGNFTVAARNILAFDCYGGIGTDPAGTGGDFGFYLTNAKLGNSNTAKIYVTAGSLGLSGAENGIVVDTNGGFTVGDSGVINLMGMGGSSYLIPGANNLGVSFNGGSITAGVAGLSGLNTVSVTGIGGAGSGGINDGVRVTGLTVTLNGSNLNNSLTFLNCMGGTQGSTNAGVDIRSGFTHQGGLFFLNCTGGSGGTGSNTQHHGVVLTSGTVAASNITAFDCVSGPGTGNDAGFYLNGGTLGYNATGRILITAGSLGTGSTEVGIRVENSSAITVGDGGTVSLTGTGGGFYNGSGTTNYGVYFVPTATMNVGVAGGTGLNTINITGIGGNGTGGVHHGVYILAGGTFTVNLLGTNINNSMNFNNCVGGTGGDTNNGVKISNGFTIPTNLNFLNCVGGSGTSNNNGVNMDAGTVVANYITATDCLGGAGTADTNIGFLVNGSLGSSGQTNRISISASSLGLGSQNYGIRNNSSIIVGDGGTISLVGTGGGQYTSTGSSNQGIFINGAVSAGVAGSSGLNTIAITGIGGSGTGGANHGVVHAGSSGISILGTNSSNSCTFLNCVGGGSGSNNIGVLVSAGFAMQGNLVFESCSGGNGTTTNYGVQMSSSTVGASTISMIDCLGGAGTNNNYGVYLQNSTLGSSATGRISINGGSLGTGSNNDGIRIEGSSLAPGNGSSIALVGTGGGFYNGVGSSNIGVNFITTANTWNVGVAGGTNSNTVNITGIGGTGVGGSHHGVSVTAATTINVLGTNAASSVNFLNCSGGSGGTGSCGVSFGASFTQQGLLTFQNCIGGSGGTGTTNYHGVVLTAGTVAASNITAVDCLGGPGISTDIGFYVSGGQLGSVLSSRILVSGGSLGTGSAEVGVRIDSGSIVTGDGGTISLIGTGGGFYGSGGTSNHGVFLSGGSIAAGALGSAGLNAINITGIGGSGSGASSAATGHMGVYSAGTTITLNGTNPANALNFMNCTGGSGSGGNNSGIQFATSGFSTPGAWTIENATGGSGGANNHGVYVNGVTVAASNISVLDATGGPGTGPDIGFYVSGGALGNLSTSRISITGNSLGSGSSEIGIKVDGNGAITAGANGTISLVGMGGGFYNGTGSGNYGVSFTNAILNAGAAGSSQTNTINVSGIGGSGIGSNQAGVNIGGGGTTFTVNLLGTSANNSLNFLNCIGGNGGSASQYGVFVQTGFSHQGNLTFQNCVGGSGANNNHGVFLSAGTVAASNITAVDCLGGPGTSTDIGFYVFGGQLGNSSTARIAVSAGSLGTGSFESGIRIDNNVVAGDQSTISLIGTGGGFYGGSGNSNHGVFLNSGSIVAGIVGSSGLNSVTITGVGGSGSGATNAATGHMGVYYAGTTVTLNGTNPSNSLNLINCTGGSGSGGNNSGVQLANAGFSTSGTWTIENATGGNGGQSNHGVFVNGIAVSAANITAVDCLGGPGIGSDIGFYVANSGTLGNTNTHRISIGGGSLGTGSNEVGIKVDTSGAITVGDTGTIALFGIGGGFYNGSGSGNYGVSFTTATLNAGLSGSSGLNTINVTGIGGSGIGSSQAGVNIGAGTFTVNLLGTNSNNSLNFLNCIGGHGGTAPQYGVFVQTGFSHQGNLTFQNCVGGSGANNNHGVFLSAGTVASSNITALDCLGGPGTSTDIGFYVFGGQLGNVATSRITISAGSLGTGSFESGIRVDNNIVVGNGGTISLTGTGGGFYSSTGNSNHGVFLNSGSITVGVLGNSNPNTLTITGIGGAGSGASSAATGHMGVYFAGTTVTVNGTNPGNSFNFINCVGGTGSGGNNSGVQLGVAFSIPGTWTIQNSTGGSGGQSNHGVFVNGVTVSASDIIGADCAGGIGIGSDIGFYVANGGALGTTNTHRISVNGNSLGTGSNEVGIRVDATSSITVGDTGTINLIGMGGGFYNGSGTGNYGVSLTAATLNAGVVGSSGLNTINITGIGGSGVGSNQAGVNISTNPFTVNLLGTNANNSLNFLNCIGGNGGSASQYAVFIQTGFSHQGNLTFQNCVGGSGSGNNYGVFFSSSNVAASSITALDCLGGPGITQDYGLYLNNSTVGNTFTQRITIHAGSLGLGTSEVGIQLDAGGIFTVGDGGTISLVGTGGGFYSGGGNSNHGVNFNGGSLVVGTANGTQLNTINVTGIGGAGAGGSHMGVLYSGSGFTLNGTNPNNSINFINCVGGNGLAGNNSGLKLTGTFSTPGAWTLQNCTGGSGGGSNHGVFVSGATVSPANIIAVDCVGGPGSGTNIGFYVSGGTVGNTTNTHRILINGGSLGTGSNESGIRIDSSSVSVASGGNITFVGTGGGFYSGTGGSNHGVFINGATFNVGVNGNTSLGTINFTGIGGAGTNGVNAGVNIATSFTVNLLGTNPDNSVNFLNCSGGSGTAQGQYGVSIQTGFSHQGKLNFQNCVGGSGSSGNHGVNISGAIVAASNISALDCLGGPGTFQDYGFYLSSATLGNNQFTSRISLNVGSLGTGSSEVGLQLDTGGSMVVTDGGTINLVGTGGGFYSSSGSANHGIFFNGGTVSAGVGGLTGLNTINITGLGGSGAGGGHIGVYFANSAGISLNGTNPANSFSFINCIGGDGTGGNNVGLKLAAAFSPSGVWTIQNCAGGSGGGSNHGVFVSGVVVTATNIAIADCTGGPGTSNDIGFYISGVGAALGNSSTTRISLQAGTIGTGSNEVGIKVDNNGAITAGPGATIQLIGSGGGFYNGAGSNNYGVSFSTATLNAGSAGNTQLNTINISGLGGAGTGGNHAGVNIDTSFTVNLLGTNSSNSLNFLNCVGGTGGGAAGQYGVYVQTGFTHQGNLVFQNCVGASGTANHGVFIDGSLGAFTVAASTITGVDCLSGPGTGSDFGFYVKQATLGNLATGHLSLSAGSLGMGSNEVGIVVENGTLTAGDGAIMELIGTGGGTYSGSGSNNWGVNFNTATLNLGTAGTKLNAIDITGIGGAGAGGNHNGVLCAGMTVNINGTNPNNALNFNNCLGGTGAAGGSSGVQFTQALATGTAALNFSNCSGGVGGTSNHGVFLNGAPAVISGANINALDCMGGPSSGSNIGFYVKNGTVGDAVTANNIAILAGSLGTGVGEVGIQIDGTGKIQAKGAGTISLQGAGGGFYLGTGSNCYGIYLKDTATVAGTTGAVELIGVPGAQTHAGIRLDAGTSVSATTGAVSLSTLTDANIQIGGGGGTSVDTTTGNINFDGPLLLTTDTVVTSSTSGDISFNSTIDGSAIGLTANAGTGSVTFVGKVGSQAPIGTLDVTGAAGITVDSSITTQGAGAVGSMTFHNAVDIGGDVVLDSTGNSTAGGNLVFAATIDSTVGLAQNLTIVAGTGTLNVSGAIGATRTLGSILQLSGASSTFGSTIQTSEPGGVNLTASAISFGGNVSLTGRGSFEANGAVTLAVSPITFDTTIGGSAGSILFTNTVDGASVTTLTAGSENITLQGLVGNTTPLTSLTATGSVITQQALVKTTNNVTYTGTAQVNLSSGITTTLGGNVSVTGPTILTSAVTVDTSAMNGNIDFHSVVDGLQTLALTSGTGNITLHEAVGSQQPLSSLSANGATVTQSSTVAVNGAGGVSYTSSVGINLGGDITSSAAAASVLVNGVTTLTAPVDVNTNNGLIHFFGTVNGTAPATQNFTLDSGSGMILLDQNIGAGVSVGALSVTTTSGSITIPAIIDAKSAAFNTPVQLATGTVITTSAGDINFDSTVQGAGDSLVLNVTGGVVTFGGNVGLVGARLASVTVNGNTELTANTTIFTDVGGTLFNGTVDGDFALTVNTLGTVTFGGLVGGVTPIGTLTILAAGSTLSTNIYTNNSVIDLTLVPITLGTNVYISTESAQTGGSPGTGANLLLGSVTGATFNLTLNSGSGDITFGNTVSGVGALTISRAANVNVNSTLSAASITQTLGTGTTAVSNPITATTGAISINTNILNFTATPTSATANLGAITLIHTGTMHIKGAITANTNFTENGEGVVSFGDSAGIITATTGTVTLNSPLLLIADPTITGVDVVINNTIDGAEPLIVNGSNTITFTSGAAIGTSTRPTSLTITAPTISIGANQKIAGAAAYNGAVTLTDSVYLETTSSGTLHVTGLVTTSGHDLMANASGTLTFDSLIDSTATTGGNITLISTGGDVIVNSIDASTTGAGPAGSITLQPASSSHAGTVAGTTIPDGKIQFLGSVTVTLSATGGALGTNGLISLAPLGRSTQQSIATIVTSSTVGSSLVFNAGALMMGTNEAMTSLGSITINTTDYTALSDIVALDNITLPCPVGYSPSNFLVSRPTALLITNDPVGAQFSPNTHILAGLLITYGCADSITPDCPCSGLTRNVAVVPGGLMSTQLVTGDGVILNFDNEHAPPPPPPPGPPGPPACPPPPPPNRSANISNLARSDAQLQDLLPTFWGPLHIPRIPKICPEYCLEECSEPILRFQSFNFANDVR